MMRPRAPVRVRINRLAHGHDLPFPAYQTAGAAGLDLVAAVAENTTVELGPGSIVMIPTGIAIELPAAHEAQVRPRSGLAARHGVTVLNSPGTIDTDYRGEISVILINHGTAPFAVRRGDRIAQMVIAPVTHASLIDVKTLSRTRRGTGGFGSTGVSSKASLQRDEKRKPVARAATPVKSDPRTPSKRKPR